MVASSYFNGKVAVVTGSSSGIGQDVARQLAAAGAKVTITGRNAEALKTTKKICIEAGAKEADVLELVGDVTDGAFATKLIEGTVAKFGGLHVLVNNAGALIPDAQQRSAIEMPIELFDANMSLNCRSVILVSQSAIAHLEKTKGSIVNVSTIVAAPFASKSAAYYGAAKAALDHITVQMAGSLIEKGIRVNSVSPGMIRTNFLTACGVPATMTEQIYAAADANTKGIPRGKVGSSEDIANTILFLADSSLSANIVGQRVVSDGGSLLNLAMFTQ